MSRCVQTLDWYCKYSDTSLSTLLKLLWQRLQPRFFLGMILQAWHTCIWGALQHSYFQVSPEMFDWVQVQALAGPLKDIQRHVPKPLLRCLGCVVRFIVLLPQSEVLGALYFSLFIFASILKSLPVPASEKHPHSLMLPTPWFTVEMVPGFLVTLGIQGKEFNFGFIRPDNLISHCLRVFRSLLGNSKRAVMCLSLRSGFHLATLT